MPQPNRGHQYTFPHNANQPINQGVLPNARSKYAPKIFRGDHRQVIKFLEDFEDVCIAYNVFPDDARCTGVLHYCSHSVRELVEALPSYVDRDWDALKRDILDLFDAELHQKRYQIGDVKAYVRNSRYKNMRDLRSWKKFYRGYLKIAGWIRQAGRMTTRDYNLFLWQGIRKSLRRRIEDRLITWYPQHDLSDPWDASQVKSAVYSILQRGTFRDDIEDADSEQTSEWEGESDDDSSSDDSSSEDERYPKRAPKKSAHKASGKTKRKESLLPSKPVNRPPKDRKSKTVPLVESEVEDLIMRMGSLSVRDPRYALLLKKVVDADSTWGDLLPKPMVGMATASPVRNMRPPNVMSAQGQAYPTTPMQLPVPSAPPGPYSQGPRPQDRPPLPQIAGCFGCGEPGHSMSICPRLAGLAAQGKIIKDPQGKIALPNGQPIQRAYGETMLQALQRDLGPLDSKGAGQVRTNLVTVDEDEESFEDEEFLDVYNVQTPASAQSYYGYGTIEEVSEESEDEPEVYAMVERPTRTIRNAREEAENAVFPRRTARTSIPTQKAQESQEQPRARARTANKIPGEKGKNAAAKVTQRREDPRADPPIEKPETSNKSRYPELTQQPVDVFVPMFDPQDEDVYMEDGEPPRLPTATAHEPESTTSVPQNPEDMLERKAKKQPVRQSIISRVVDPKQVLVHILRTPVSLPIGDILGASKELSALLAENMRPKSTKKDSPAALTTEVVENEPDTFLVGPSLTHEKLLQFEVSINGHPITAILDSGSQLNIIRKEIADLHVRLPLDRGHTLRMSDANGGKGDLLGIIQDAPIRLGTLQTKGNLWAATHVKFELLLGRPWQRDNYASIDERLNGTWLTFKDPRNLNRVRHELLLQEREIPSSILDVPDDELDRGDDPVNIVRRRVQAYQAGRERIPSAVVCHSVSVSSQDSEKNALKDATAESKISEIARAQDVEGANGDALTCASPEASEIGESATHYSHRDRQTLSELKNSMDKSADYSPTLGSQTAHSHWVENPARAAGSAPENEKVDERENGPASKKKNAPEDATTEPRVSEVARAQDVEGPKDDAPTRASPETSEIGGNAMHYSERGRQTLSELKNSTDESSDYSPALGSQTACSHSGESPAGTAARQLE
ncbi:hypothetical protein OF83DRAFT_1088149 [Amylostereum chailletii]|nr:hypothetical protein OF83DRAFT_1088149 [Amylostereum chailletii]